MTEYSKSARGSFTSTGAAKVIYLPFQPNIIRMTNYTAAATPAQNGVPFANWDAAMGQGGGIMQIFNATPVLVTDNITSGGFSTFSAGQLLQFGSQIQISGITKASPAVVTTAANHGYSTGDVVIFQGLYQSATTGMPQICGIPFVVTVTGATTFTIPWNTNQSNYTALSGSPSGAFVKKVLYPDIYLPGVNVITAISTGSSTTVSTTTNHNFVAGQQVVFRIPSSWGTTQLNSPQDYPTPGATLFGTVSSVSSNTQFVVNIDSSSFTSFNSNQTVASVPGLSFPQVLAAGDINSGGAVYSGGSLYPSPSFPTSSGGVATINGPAIQGAFVNNSRQGFIIGAGTAVTLTSAVLVGANSDVIYWEAYYSELYVS